MCACVCCVKRFNLLYLSVIITSRMRIQTKQHTVHCPGGNRKGKEENDQLFIHHPLIITCIDTDPAPPLPDSHPSPPQGAPTNFLPTRRNPLSITHWLGCCP